MTGLQEAFQGVRGALHAAGVEYAIGGSWASTTYGEPRQTNDIDLIAGFDRESLLQFLHALGDGYYFDEETALQAFRLSRPFNVIHRAFSFKFDFFPIHDEHGRSELQRVRHLQVSALDEQPVPVVSPEDMIIAKLRWFRAGREVSSQQWRDIVGILRLEGSRLDQAYLEEWTRRLQLADLFERARRDTPR